jgi:hypothetical protein
MKARSDKEISIPRWCAEARTSDQMGATSTVRRADRPLARDPTHELAGPAPPTGGTRDRPA